MKVVAGCLCPVVAAFAVGWAAPGVLLTYLLALSEAWVLLVEIHR